MKEKVKRILNLPNDWKINDLLKLTDKEIYWACGTILQRELQKYQPGTVFGPTPWKKSATICAVIIDKHKHI